MINTVLYVVDLYLISELLNKNIDYSEAAEHIVFLGRISITLLFQINVWDGIVKILVSNPIHHYFWKKSAEYSKNAQKPL